MSDSADPDDFLPTGWWLILWSVPESAHASASIVVGLLPGFEFRTCLLLMISNFCLKVTDPVSCSSIALPGACSTVPVVGLSS